MISAIVYNSLTGSCQKYANLLSARLHAPAFPLKNAPVRSDGKIIYIGWLFAGKIVGLKKAAKKFDIAAVVQVGMAPVGPGSDEICREMNSVPADTAVFCRQGAFNMGGLPLPFRLIMKLKNKDIVSKLQAKGQLNAQEQALYTMASTGVGQPADWNVDDIAAWAE